MSVEVIHCPACQNQLRVSESLFGEPVTCPQCRVTFQAPQRSADGTMGRPELLTASAAKPNAVPSGNRLLLPGLAVLLVGMMGLLSNGWLAFAGYNDPERMIDESMENLKNPAYQKMLEGKEITREQISEGVLRLRTWCLVLGGLSAIVTFGGVAILIRRFYWLGVVASGIAIVNPPCCCLGLPAGVFGLVKLLDPAARALFGK